MSLQLRFSKLMRCCGLFSFKCVLSASTDTLASDILLRFSPTNDFKYFNDSALHKPKFDKLFLRFSIKNVSVACGFHELWEKVCYRSYSFFMYLCTMYIRACHILPKMEIFEKNEKEHRNYFAKCNSKTYFY